MKETKAFEKTKDSNTILENPSSMFLQTPKHLLITNTETGKLEVSNSDQVIGYNYWTQYSSEQTWGRKLKVGIRWEDRGGSFSIAPMKISPTLVKYRQLDKLESVLTAEPLLAREWGQNRCEFREIHTEILTIFGEVTKDTYNHWDNGNYQKNIERSYRLFDADRVKSNDLFEDSKIEVDICTEKFIRKLEALMVDDDYIVHQEVFQKWAMWNELKKNSDKWNVLFKRIGLADCQIQDRHKNLTTDACLEWFAVLLRKYNYKVNYVYAKPGTTKTLACQLAKPKYLAQLTKWRLEGNKSQTLETFFWDKLVNEEYRLTDLTANALTLLNCYPHIQIVKQGLSRRNSIS